MNADHIRGHIDETWSTSIVPALEQYIRIPNQSPLFDPEWKRNGHMHRAVALARRACQAGGPGRGARQMTGSGLTGLARLLCAARDGAAAVEFARERGITVLPLCPYAKSVFGGASRSFGTCCEWRSE